MAQNTNSSGGTGRSTRRRGPFGRLLDLFSSVWLGIFLLSVLFVYATVGSAGIIYPAPGAHDFTFLGIGFRHEMLRQWRVFELTEYEWFNTPFFVVLIGLICTTLIVTTLRRIRFNALNAGVWMIHTGIVVLALGSVWYFSVKVEGDSPVVRRAVVIEVPGAKPVRLLALTGKSVSVESDSGTYGFSISMIDPSWELLSGEDTGKSAYSVSVLVQPPTGDSFARRLLAGYPEYTEDVIPGRGRVKKLEEFGGQVLVDDSIHLSLDYAPQRWFWVKDSASAYVRTVGAPSWAQRRLNREPRYNDSFPRVTGELWPIPPDRDGRVPRPRTLDISAAASPTDPLGDVDVKVTGYLRYATMYQMWEPGGETLNPVLDLTISDGQSPDQSVTLVAMDPHQRSQFGGRLQFDWVESAEELEGYKRQPKRHLTLRAVSTGDEVAIDYQTAEELGEEPLAVDADVPLEPIGDSGFSYRIVRAIDHLPLQDGTVLRMVIVRIRNPEGNEFDRWVFEDSSRNRDNPITAVDHASGMDPPDPRLESTYAMVGSGPSALLTIVGGPGEIGLHAFLADPQLSSQSRELTVGQMVPIAQDLMVRVDRLLMNGKQSMRPHVVPWRQRDRNADAAHLYSMYRLEVSSGGETEARWVPFQPYVFDDDGAVMQRLTPFWSLARFALADGREIELVMGRSRHELPVPIVLDDFILTSHLGGYTGSTASVRDWTSVVRWATDDGWSDPVRVSSNSPSEISGYWFFQSSWDPPERPSQSDPFGSPGLTYTGLGVGNRHGVMVQLAGTVIAVVGMLYAFYVKPIVRRRRRRHVLAEVRAGAYGEAAQARVKESALEVEEVAL